MSKLKELYLQQGKSLPPPNMTVTDSRLFKDGGSTRLWVKYGPTGN